MKYHELSANKRKNSTRVGRGISAGKGKTAGRGTKGQSSRAGGRVRPGFEGGQNPLYMRLPKLPGFRAVRPKAEVVYTGQLNTLDAKVIDNHVLAEANIISNPYVRTKLVAKGEITKKVSVKLQAASESAVSMIQKAGGTFVTCPQVARPTKSKDTKTEA
jgi:large subunit ribosomal protein L15